MSTPPQIDATSDGGARYSDTEESSLPWTSVARNSAQRWFAASSTAYAFDEYTVTCSFVRVVYAPPQKPAGAAAERSTPSGITAGPTASRARLGAASVRSEAPAAGAATGTSIARTMTHTRTDTPAQCCTVAPRATSGERHDHRGAECGGEARGCAGARENKHAPPRPEQQHAADPARHSGNRLDCVERKPRCERLVEPDAV